MDDFKKPWLSKTMWAAALTALVPLFPPAAAIVAANPGLVSAAVGFIFAALRLTTDKKIGMQ